MLGWGCGGPSSSTTETSDDAGETATGTDTDSDTAGENTCPSGQVHVEPACDDGHAGTVLPPAGCQTPCGPIGAECPGGVCLPASVHEEGCACEGGGACCPECREVAPLCLDPALYDCERYTDAADCEAIKGIWPGDQGGGSPFCSWERIVEVTDPASCTFGAVRDACVAGTFIGDGCFGSWDECLPYSLPIVFRGPPFEVMHYEQCVGSSPPGWKSCSGPDTSPACACACAPDYPG